MCEYIGTLDIRGILKEYERTAQEPLTVYKVGLVKRKIFTRRKPKETFVSGVQGYKYRFGNQYHGDLQYHYSQYGNNDKILKVTTGQGFYSYSTLEEAIRCQGEGQVIVEAEIPEGATYVTGEVSGVYVSDRIIIRRVVKESIIQKIKSICVK